MNRTILQLLAVTVCFATVQALTCYQCKIGIWNLCLTSQKMCAAGELCFNGKGQAAGFMDVSMKGCLARSECNKTTSTDFPTADNSSVYTMTKTCCNTDLCNSAPGLPGALQLALATLAAVFAANTLV